MTIKIIKNKTTGSIVTLAFVTFQFISCKENIPQPTDIPENETELITTVILEFKDSNTNAISYGIFRDADGPGGNSPSKFDTIKLDANGTYITKVLLLDESKTPADTISNEVLKEADDHLFVFTPNAVNVNIRIKDRDSNQLPVGLLSSWKTGTASKGMISVVLKHQPGVKDGTADPGETDVAVNFHCEIQ